jgi:hypothetical protein
VFRLKCAKTAERRTCAPRWRNGRLPGNPFFEEIPQYRFEFALEIVCGRKWVIGALCMTLTRLEITFPERLQTFALAFDFAELLSYVSDPGKSWVGGSGFAVDNKVRPSALLVG